MKLITTTKNGTLTSKDQNYFGGTYSFLEKLKMKGIGSPKIIYKDGIEAFDILKREVEGEIGFVNFELLKNGLILRLNINQRIACIGFKLNEILEINLVAYRIEIKTKQFGHFESKIVHRGELGIKTQDEVLKFSILVGKFDDIVNYFIKNEFGEKFYYAISPNPPEQDEADFSEFLDILDSL